MRLIESVKIEKINDVILCVPWSCFSRRIISAISKFPNIQRLALHGTGNALDQLRGLGNDDLKCLSKRMKTYENSLRSISLSSFGLGSYSSKAIIRLAILNPHLQSLSLSGLTGTLDLEQLALYIPELSSISIFFELSNATWDLQFPVLNGSLACFESLKKIALRGYLLADTVLNLLSPIVNTGESSRLDEIHLNQVLFPPTITGIQKRNQALHLLRQFNPRVLKINDLDMALVCSTLDQLPFPQLEILVIETDNPDKFLQIH
ncbi:hypothetical protein HK096_001812, partial [Nowakowskiella sp. JEL0078]